VTASFIEYAAPKSTDFPTAWRLLQSAQMAGPSDEVDAWVRLQLAAPEQWMLRQAAVDAATARGHREDARACLADRYPRVRERAAAALSGDSATLMIRATLARRDAWPMVRAEAVLSLRNEAEAIPVIVASVDDSMSLVRAAAIEVLTDLPHDDGWEPIHRRLRARNEWPEVTAAAVEYVAAHCRADAAEDLLRVVLRAAPSNARTDDLNNGARAIEALRILRTPEAEAVVFELMSWREGHFRFEESNPEEFPENPSVAVSTESVLMEAARRIDEWSRIADRVPSLSHIAEFADLGASLGERLDIARLVQPVAAVQDGDKTDAGAQQFFAGGVAGFVPLTGAVPVVRLDAAGFGQATQCFGTIQECSPVWSSQTTDQGGK